MNGVKDTSSIFPVHLLLTFMHNTLSWGTSYHNYFDSYRGFCTRGSQAVSFLTWVKSDDIEGGFCSIPDDNFDLAKHTHYEKDLMLSFQVNKHVSNANLHRILAVLPNPKDLDARGTGSVEVVDAQTVGENKNVLARVNVDGLLDEQWGWFAGWQLCNVL